MTEPVVRSAARCVGCGTDLSSGALSCPLCHRLVHASELEALAREAEGAAARGEPSSALAAWRHALALLPPRARQAESVRERIETLSRALEASGQTVSAPADSRGSSSSRSRIPAILGGLGGLGMLLWKSKVVIAFVATKGKLLLLGLTKSSTLFSMLLSAGVYWSIWGWRFAVGLVLSIYVHEMGHVSALRRLGIAASAPMFVPGLGAMVRLNQYPASPRENARVGLAGPIWGLVASACTLAAGFALETPMLIAIGRFSAWINLFNLLPVWQLDGARGFHALSSQQRWICIAVMLAAWVLSEESLLVLLALGGAFYSFTQPAARGPDAMAFGQMIGCIAAAAAMCAIPLELR